MTDARVTPLMSVAPGFRCDSDAQIVTWLRDWLDQVEEDGNVRSLILIVETTDGNVYHLGQTTHKAAGLARVLGLLQLLAHKLLHGTGRHPSIEEAERK